MDIVESDKDMASCIENEDQENSSEEDSEEESDDDSDEDKNGTDDVSEGEDEDGEDAVSEEEDEDGEDAVSEGEDEDGEDAVSEGEDEETVSDNDDGGEAASAATVEEASDKEDLLDLGDPDMSCPICLNEFAGQDLGSPENCSHTFCFECIMEWSKNINTCPIDRIEFHLIYMKQEINGDVLKKVKVKVQKEVEEYVEEATLCEICRSGDREDRLLLCDSCDSGYHCECLDPPLETIPIEEWFCPPCSQVLNRRASIPQASHSRLIARTSASEIVRSRIQHHRTTNSGDSGSETTQQSHRVHSPARAPKRRKTTKRKTKRKTTRKSFKSKKMARTKATAGGKSKLKKGSSKTPTKRKRKTKRRKTVKKKKKSKKSWLASMKLVAPSVKKRIADHLGLCKPPPGQSMPYIKKSGGQSSSFVEQSPSLDMFGGRVQLFDFNESYTDDDLDNPKPSTSKQRTQAIAVRSSMAVASTSGINLLDNILEKQNDLLRKSRNITIGKDGSLNVNEQSFSVRVKYGIKSLKNEPKNDESVLEQSKTASSSSVYVQKERNVSITDSPSTDFRKNSSEGGSALSCTVKKEKPDLHPRVRFNDTETVFRIGGACEQIEQKLFSIPAEKEYNQLCSSLLMREKEDISPEKASCIKKEKDDGLLLNSLLDTESESIEQAIAASLDVNRGSLNKKHKMNVKESHQFHKNSFGSPLSLLNSSCKENFDSVVDSSVTTTNKLNFPCSTDNCNSSKDMSSTDSCEPMCEKMGDTPKSLFNKAENDRKRHLPFLSNGLRPFKIPKLAKSISKSLASEVKLPSSESINNDLESKVLTKAETVSGNLVSEELLKNTTSHCDLKLENGCQKKTFVDHNDQNETMDVEVCGDQSNISSTGANSLSQTSKQEKARELYKNNKKSDLNSKSSSHIRPKQVTNESENRQSRGNSCNFERTGDSFHKVANHASPSGLNSNFTKCFRKKSHNVSPISSSKGVKSIKHEHLLTVSSVEVRTSKPTNKSSALENRELKSSDKMSGKVSSKYQLKEDIADEIKKHLKDFYVTDLITKEEYKEIMRRCVPKVFQNCGNSIDSEKIRKLVVSYVHLISNTKPDSS